MANELLEQLITLAGSQARQVIIDTQQMLCPTWVLVDKAGKQTTLTTAWHNELEREIAKLFMLMQVHKHKTVAYLVYSEVWMSKAPKDWNPQDGFDKLPQARKDPARTEGVIALATDGKEKLFKSWQIKRDWNERVTALEERPGPDDDVFASWISRLLG